MYLNYLDQTLIVLILSGIIILYYFAINYSYDLVIDNCLKNQNKIVVLFNFNNEGGFFWGIHNVCNLYWYCDKYRCIPIVYYDSGYYKANNVNDFGDDPIPNNINNWFEYYYYPLSSINSKKVVELLGGIDRIPEIDSKGKPKLLYSQYGRETFEIHYKETAP